MTTFVDTPGRVFRWNVKKKKAKGRVETKVYMTTKVDSGNTYGVPEILQNDKTYLFHVSGKEYFDSVTGEIASALTHLAMTCGALHYHGERSEAISGETQSH